MAILHKVSATTNNIAGADNIFMGYHSGFNNTAGSENVFIGKHSGYMNDSSNLNVFIGAETGYNTTNGQLNLFAGAYSGYLNQSGSENVFLGRTSGQLNTEGSEKAFSASLLALAVAWVRSPALILAAFGVAHGHHRRLAHSESPVRHVAPVLHVSGRLLFHLPLHTES